MKTPLYMAWHADVPDAARLLVEMLALALRLAEQLHQERPATLKRSLIIESMAALRL